MSAGGRFQLSLPPRSISVIVLRVAGSSGGRPHLPRAVTRGALLVFEERPK